MKASSIGSISVAAILWLCPPLLKAEDVKVDAQQREALAITLYNQNLGLVREARKFPALAPNQSVILEDISQSLQIESLRISGIGQLIEQNLNTNILTQQSLLNHYVGKSLQLARLNPATGQETVSTVELINISGNRALIKRNQQIETIPLNDNWRFIFPSIPEKLLSKPSVNFKTTGTSRPNAGHMSYLTSGLDWNMDYVLTVDRENNQLALEGLASLTNNTGTDFTNTHISLLAGEVNQPSSNVLRRKASAEVLSALPINASPTREKIQGFHLYNLPRNTDLLNGQVKQVNLIAVSKVPFQREYDYQFLVYPSLERNQHTVKPNLSISFTNDKESQLGLPLPAGNIRTFTPDSQGTLQFTGGTPINHTAEGEQISIEIGKSFDLSVHRKQTHFSKTFKGYLVGQELRITNPLDQEVSITMTARFPLAWEMKQSSHSHEIIQGSSAEWTIDVPAKGDAVLAFSVEMEKR